MVEKASFRALIHGRVQGVFFRSTVETWARELGLCGFVRNLPGDLVEVFAEGPKEKLEVLARRCKKGPPAARVTDLEIEWADFKGEFAGFYVR